MKDEKTDGKKKMLQTWEHILNGLCDILKNDPKIRPDVFDEQFTEKQLADILFSLILVSMIRQDYNPSSILMLINKNIILNFSHIRVWENFCNKMNVVHLCV